MVFNVSIVFAQFDNISIIGQFTNWSADVPLATEDGITYTLSSQNFGVAGGAKFRKDNAWVTDWGSNTFPTGTGVSYGAEIPTVAGTYNVTITDSFNCTFTTENVTITEPLPLNASLAETGNLTCQTQTTLTLTVSGGTPPYMYSTDGINFTSNFTYLVSPGTYQFYENLSNNYKLFARLDWNISKNHRFSVRYNQVESKSPSFASTSTSGSLVGTTGFAYLNQRSGTNKNNGLVAICIKRKPISF